MYIRDLLINILNKVGLQFWWPVDIEYHKKTGGFWEFEVILGAILTQNTKWDFVEKNINYLKEKGFIFDEKNILKLCLDDIKVPMKKRKLETIKNFFNFFIENFSDIKDFKKEKKENLREEILKIDGIGNETADVIILYSAEKPELVIDSYTKRLLYINKIIDNLNISYNKLKKILTDAINECINDLLDAMILKVKELDKEKTLKEKFNAKTTDILPLNPFNLLENVREEEKITIVYKEIHAIIDVYYKDVIKKAKIINKN